MYKIFFPYRQDLPGKKVLTVTPYEIFLRKYNIAAEAVEW